jgi:hypothetical protein
MADTLAQLIVKVQGQLLDDGTKFIDAVVTVAMRQALRYYNQIVPLPAVVSVVAVDNQLIYDVTAVELSALVVRDVWLADADGEEDTPLPFDSYRGEDGHIFIRLRSARSAGETLSVVCGIPHTISGLDGGTTSTVSAFYDQVLIDGACYYACAMKAVSMLEDVVA